MSETNPSGMRVHYSSKRPDWETPPGLFAEWNREFGFTLDAAALPHNAKCPRFFTPDDDGLAQDWGTETVWVNPPYGKPIAAWMRKAWDASLGGATVVMLVPSRTDTRWWHDYAMRGEIRFHRGRIRFVGATAGAPFPCALVIFRPKRSERAASVRLPLAAPHPTPDGEADDDMVECPVHRTLYYWNDYCPECREAEIGA